eukprot:11483459-Prorocentrum_lima.AAC.1
MCIRDRCKNRRLRLNLKGIWDLLVAGVSSPTREDCETMVVSAESLALEQVLTEVIALLR